MTIAAESTDLVFDPFSDTFFVDPYPTYRRMRDEAPVYYNETYDFYALSRYDDVARGQRDYETYTSTYGITLAMVKMAQPQKYPSLIMLDPPEHRRMRSLVNRVFTPRAIAGLEPMIRSLLSEHLEQCDPTSFDAVQDFAGPFPVEVISEMLGIPSGERQQIRHWLDDVLSRNAGEIGISAAGHQASTEMGAYMFGLIQQRRAHPQDDMITRLIEAEIDRDEGGATRLDDIEIASFLTLLGGAGAETVTKLIGNAVVLFAQHPDQWAALQAERRLIPAAIEEVLRYQAPSQYNVRRATRTHELHGVTIPEGAAVFMLVGSANRDERQFKEADRFDITRDAVQNANIGFGYGIHSCLGAALARLESRVALDLLLDLLPEYSVDFNGLVRVNMSNVAGYSSVPTRRAA